MLHNEQLQCQLFLKTEYVHQRVGRIEPQDQDVRYSGQRVPCHIFFALVDKLIIKFSGCQALEFHLEMPKNTTAVDFSASEIDRQLNMHS